MFLFFLKFCFLFVYAPHNLADIINGCHLICIQAYWYKFTYSILREWEMLRNCGHCLTCKTVQFCIPAGLTCLFWLPSWSIKLPCPTAFCKIGAYWAELSSSCTQNSARFSSKIHGRLKRMKLSILLLQHVNLYFIKSFCLNFIIFKKR